MIYQPDNVQSKYLIWFLMLVFMCLSGNPLFAFEPNTTAFVAVIVLMFVLLRYNYIIDKIIRYAWIFILIYIIQSLIVPNFSISATGYITIKLFLGLSLAYIIGRKFIDAYIDVMWFISLCSIPLFFITTTYGELPGFTCALEGKSLVIYTQLVGWNGVLPRNSGMFWEPGCFAGYICVALLFCLLTNRGGKKLIIPFIVALATTYSTTGYLVFFFILLYYLKNNHTIDSFTKIFLIIAACVAIYISYNSLDFLGEKINKEDGSNSRIANYDRYASIILNNIIFGISYTDEAPTGNGFISFICEVGIIGVIYYFARLFAKLRETYNLEQTVFFIAAIVIMLQGECYMDYPLFMALPCIAYVNRRIE